MLLFFAVCGKQLNELSLQQIVIKKLFFFGKVIRNWTCGAAHAQSSLGHATLMKWLVTGIKSKPRFGMQVSLLGTLFGAEGHTASRLHSGSFASKGDWPGCPARQKRCCRAALPPRFYFRACLLSPQAMAPRLLKGN